MCKSCASVAGTAAILNIGSTRRSSRLDTFARNSFTTCFVSRVSVEISQIGSTTNAARARSSAGATGILLEPSETPKRGGSSGSNGSLGNTAKRARRIAIASFPEEKRASASYQPVGSVGMFMVNARSGGTSSVAVCTVMSEASRTRTVTVVAADDGSLQLSASRVIAPGATMPRPPASKATVGSCQTSMSSKIALPATSRCVTVKRVSSSALSERGCTTSSQSERPTVPIGAAGGATRSCRQSDSLRMSSLVCVGPMGLPVASQNRQLTRVDAFLRSFVRAQAVTTTCAPTPRGMREGSLAMAIDAPLTVKRIPHRLVSRPAPCSARTEPNSGRSGAPIGTFVPEAGAASARARTRDQPAGSSVGNRSFSSKS